MAQTIRSLDPLLLWGHRWDLDSRSVFCQKNQGAEESLVAGILRSSVFMEATSVSRVVSSCSILAGIT